jgi:hypothetical protein
VPGVSTGEPPLAYQDRATAPRFTRRRRALVLGLVAAVLVPLLLAEFLPRPRLHVRLLRLWRLRQLVPAEPIWNRSIPVTALRNGQPPGARPPSLDRLLALPPGAAVLLVTGDTSGVHVLTVELAADRNGTRPLDLFKLQTYHLPRPDLWSGGGWGPPTPASAASVSLHCPPGYAQRLDVTPDGPSRWRLTLLDGEGPVADVSAAHSENSGALTVAGQLNDRGVKRYLAHTQ